MNEWISTNNKLPKNNTYVLAHIIDRPWGDSDDQESIFYKVLKFEKGISQKERELMKQGKIDCPMIKWQDETESPRWKVQTGADEEGNNEKPYHWTEFGPGSYFGQEIDYWMDIPKLSNK